MDFYSFERQLGKLQSSIKILQSQHLGGFAEALFFIEDKIRELKKEKIKRLTAYETIQIARHPKRPTVLQLIDLMFSDFIELHGDRNFYDDQAIVGGLAKLDGQGVMVIGHQKGQNTREKINRNFGMAKPEGYRKALRLMEMAERFQLPVLSFIDTPGAYPGVGAEERGQSEAIGKNIMIMSRLKTPVISLVWGEGGSGGALAIGVGNVVMMMEHATYSVISPEGCAAILMKDAKYASMAAEALKMQAKDCLRLGVVDEIIEEPEGGAHCHPLMVSRSIKERIKSHLDKLKGLSGQELRDDRQKKVLSITNFL